MTDSDKDQQQVALMSLNATKAGMEGLDKAAINAIIEEASKGSKFYEQKKASQKRIDAKKEAMRQKLKSLGQDAIRKAETKADKLIEQIKMTENQNKLQFWCIFIIFMFFAGKMHCFNCISFHLVTFALF